MAKKIKKTASTVSAREAIASTLNTLDELELDPIMELGKIYKGESPLVQTNDPEVKIQILKELAQYATPKRKAVDINLESEEGITVKIIKVSSPQEAAKDMFKPAELKKEKELNGDNPSV